MLAEKTLYEGYRTISFLERQLMLLKRLVIRYQYLVIIIARIANNLNGKLADYRDK